VNDSAFYTGEVNTGGEVVAVLDTSEDTVGMLRFVLERAGFAVVSALMPQFRDGRVDLDAFIQQHRPAVIVYDIVPPYHQSWQQFLRLRSGPACRDIQFVLTTTNRRHVADLVEEPVTLHEIIGKPYDLDEIVAAVTQAARGEPIAPSERRHGPVDRRTQSHDRRRGSHSALGQ
jgi:DNA-binding response OmpR family regulator